MDDTVTTPAINNGPHLLGPAYPPAAVRAGNDGKESEINAFLFLSWSVGVNRLAYLSFVTPRWLTLYGG